MQPIVDYLASIGLSGEAIVILVSMLPIFELRGGIPLGVFLFKFGIIKTVLLSLTGNLAVILPVVLLLDPVSKWIEGINGGNNILEKLRQKALTKSALVQKLEFVGLMLFVSIPLPGSGAWTGALIYFFLKLDKKKSIVFIALGVFIASIAVGLLTYLIDIGIIKNAGLFLKEIGV
ncbi:small multi-drug export protein [bacterium]|nr:small multi-drug export protein [bacterium]